MLGATPYLIFQSSHVFVVILAQIKTLCWLQNATSNFKLAGKMPLQIAKCNSNFTLAVKMPACCNKPGDWLKKNNEQFVI